MAQYSKDGHRQRLRESYIKNGASGLFDRDLLELLLTYAIPRRDVKPIAYNLLNEFGSLEAVLNAEVGELAEVDGIGENSAVLISLVHAVHSKIGEDRNKRFKSVLSVANSIEYFSNLLKDEVCEKFLVMTLTSNNEMLNIVTVGEGNSACVEVNCRKVMEVMAKSKAAGMIISHNHPNASKNPSLEDINFTMELLNVSRKMKISLIDHIIIGRDGAFSFRADPRYSAYFI